MLNPAELFPKRRYDPSWKTSIMYVGTIENKTEFVGIVVDDKMNPHVEPLLIPTNSICVLAEQEL